MTENKQKCKHELIQKQIIFLTKNIKINLNLKYVFFVLLKDYETNCLLKIN